LLFKSLTSKVIYKIGFLVVIIIAVIISSFIILVYFQSQQTLLGNSINIAGKNRFLTISVLFQTSEYLNGILSALSSPSLHAPSSISSMNSTAKLNDATNNLNTNLLVLKDGGKTSNIELRPLSSKFLDSWKIINNDWNKFRNFITLEIVKPSLQQRAQLQSKIPGNVTTTSKNVTSIPTTTAATATSAAKLYRSIKPEVGSLASNVINSSDILVTQLGNDAAIDSRNLILLEILLAIVNIAVVLLILYFVKKILKPIDILTDATSQVKKGNLEVSVQHKGNDELSLLGESFNSMVQSIKNYIKKQNQLTSELKGLNQQLKYKDQLKDQFINIAAHELRTPIQPILGLTEVIRSRNAASAQPKQDAEFLEIIIRNARRLQGLSEKILDISKIENRILRLDKQKFNIHENLRNIINDIKSKEKGVEIIFAEPNVDPVIVEADRIRIDEVISNLLTNAVESSKISMKTGSSPYEQGHNTISVFTTIRLKGNGRDNNKDNHEDEKEGEIVISIKDRGTGIDPEIREKLFTIFVTKSETGSGLGLFISKGIVEAHGGKIWAENNADGKGATFSFSLPIIN
jgi:signal transduction histidine kinase